MYRKFLIILLMITLGFSCKNADNNNDSSTEQDINLQNSKTDMPDVTGYYQLPELGCNIALTIVKENGLLKYYFKGEHLDLEGIAIVHAEEDIYYVTFDGPIGNTPPKTVMGQFKDNSITIQNTGNTMNNFHYFLDCGDKYLEFKRN